MNSQLYSRCHKVAFALAGVLIVLGFFLHPIDLFLFNGDFEKDKFLSITILLVQLTPLVPLALAVLSFWRSVHLPRRFLKIISTSIICVGILITFFIAAFSGPGTELVMFKGAALTASLAGSFIIAFGKPISSRRVKVAYSWLVFGAFAACWSLISTGAVVYGARNIAGSFPFCIAHHENSRTIRAWSDLRGFEFYTTATGYKDSSQWYFHGLLIVEAETGTKYYNWSPRYLRFDVVENFNVYRVSLMNTCMPVKKYLITVPLI